MLTLQKVHELLERLELSKRGRELVLKARDLAPVREVGSSGSNVVTRYQSRKMTREVGLESRHIEYKAALLAEYDPKVLEYFAQPMKLEEFLVGPITGKRYKICHTPDLMLLTEHGVFVDECKPEHRLRAMAAKFPDRYMLKEGRWHSPIWESFFEPLGIRYRLRLDTEMPTLLVANLEFLADYLAPDSPRVPESSKKLVLAKFDQAVVRELSDLIEESLTTGAGYTADDLYKMIADAELAVDLENDEVYETDRLRVYRDQAALRFCRIQYESRRDPPSGDLMTAIESGARLRYEDRMMEVITATANSVLVNVENRIKEMSLDDLIGLFQSGRVTILPPPGHDHEDPKTEDYLNSLGPALMAEIDKRLRLIERASVNPELEEVSERTLRRWKEKMRKAGESFYDQAKALAPKTGLRGNRKTRLNPEVLEAIRVTGKDYYNTKLCPSKIAAYEWFVDYCAKHELKWCSFNAFRNALKTITAKRKGRKVAYQEGEIIWYLEARVPIHGVRPFQFVHLDSTPIEITAHDPVTKDVLGTVYLTMAVDAATRRVLGFYLSFRKPGYLSTMMVIRDIVRRHGRLPETIIVDNGSEFTNEQLERLCRVTRVHIEYRPKGHPRVGTVIERMFETTDTQFIYLLEGNTKILKHHRMVTKDFRPENFTEWTLLSLHGGLELFFDQRYGTDPHPAHGFGPVEYCNIRLAQTGERRHRLVRYDKLFKIETCPAPKRGPTVRVDAQMGVKINYIWYWAKELGDPSVAGKDIQVRYDPWDPGTAFALVGKNWVECKSKYWKLLSRYTVTELMYMLDQLKRRLGRKTRITPEWVEEILGGLDPKNFDPRLAAQNAEMRLVREPLGLGAVIPLPEPMVVGLENVVIDPNSQGPPEAIKATEERQVPPLIQDLEVDISPQHLPKRYDDGYPLI